MELTSIIWIASIIATVVICSQKNFSGWWVFWSFFLGPLIAIWVYFKTEQTGLNKPDLITNLQTEITTLKLEVRDLKMRLSKIEQGGTPISPLADEVAEPKTDVPLTDEELADLVESKPLEEAEAEVPKPSPASEPPLVSPIRITESQPAMATSTSEEKQPSNAEINFGKFWLNKIGIVIFTLGIGFFISYSFQYFSPLIKNLLGYAVAGILFYLGRRFSKQDQLKNYGLALMGAGWAVTYFVTYALHHFDASRVIESQALDIVLLFIVAVGMMGHALKVQSETMMMISLGVAYVTSLIGDVTTFTFFSSAILGCVVIFLLYRFQWIKTLFMGIGMTYGIHFLFVGPAIDSGDLLTLGGNTPGPSLEMAFLSAYALVYFVGTHIVRGEGKVEQDCAAAGNVINFLLYFVLSGPVFENLYPEKRMLMLAVLGSIYLVAGILMRFRQRQRMYASDILIALVAFTLASYLQFLPLTALMIWFIQAPFILFAGLRFRDAVLQYASHGISAVCFISFIDLFDWGFGTVAAQVMGEPWTMMQFVALVATIAMALSYTFYRMAQLKKESVGIVAKIYCALALIYGNAWLSSVYHGPWYSLCLFGQVVLLVGLGRWLRESVVKAAALLVTGLACVVIVAQDYMASEVVTVTFLGQTMTHGDWTCFFGSIALWFAFGLSHPEAMRVSKNGGVNIDNHIYSGLAMILANIWLYEVLNSIHISLAITIEAIVLFNVSLLFTLKRFRVYGYVALLFALIRFVGVDSYGDLNIQAWLMIGFQLLAWLGLYLAAIFKRNEKDAEIEVKEGETIFLFVGFVVLLTHVIFEFMAPGWRSLCIGASAVGMIALGLLVQDRIARFAGFITLAVGLLRIIFVDMAKLTTIYKIISFIVIGALLLGLSYLYNKYFAGEQRPEQRIEDDGK